AYNTLVNNARKTADPAVRMKYMMDAEKLLIDDMPFIPLYHRSYTLMVSPKLKNEGYIVANNAIGTYYIELNITNKAFEDKRVRQALSLAIDRNYLVKNVTKGGQVPAGAFVPTEVRGLNSTFRKENKEYI
uniref:ABC transporter substrate-binding protein n=1 Tax=Brachyspira hyodysenteriae TaxID=159 RepID=UPI001F5397EC